MNRESNVKDATATLFSAVATLAILLGGYSFAVGGSYAELDWVGSITVAVASLSIQLIGIICIVVALKALFDLFCTFRSFGFSWVYWVVGIVLSSIILRSLIWVLWLSRDTSG